MNDFDRSNQELEKLLTHLGTVEVNLGFEDRIRHGVNARQEHRRKQPQRWFLGVAAILAAAALCTTLWLHDKPQASAQPKVTRLATPLQQAAPTRVDSDVKPMHVVHLAHATKTPRQSLPTFEASFPAPPAPLTEQERLLVRLAHRGDPEELAMLDPNVRALDEAMSRAEFDKFFAPPSIPEDEKPSTQQK
jgi:hypothetical protein